MINKFKFEFKIMVHSKQRSFQHLQRKQEASIISTPSTSCHSVKKTIIRVTVRWELSLHAARYVSVQSYLHSLFIQSYLLSSPHPFQFQNQPMVLSRRTSYKIANGSPRGHSPVVAMELKFDSPAQARKKFKGNNSSSAKPIRWFLACHPISIACDKVDGKQCV